jgi:hypothetical protein
MSSGKFPTGYSQSYANGASFSCSARGCQYVWQFASRVAVDTCRLPEVVQFLITSRDISKRGWSRYHSKGQHFQHFPGAIEQCSGSAWICIRFVSWGSGSTFRMRIRIQLLMKLAPKAKTKSYYSELFD